MNKIPLTQGQFSIVDDADYLKLSKLKWCAVWDPDTKTFRASRGVSRNGKTTTVFLHREIIGVVERTRKVDHKNHDTLDNRRENLRVCTNAENCRNRRGPRARSFSGVRGVCWNKKCGKWRAQIRVGGKNRHLGLFISKAAAGAAYIAANRTHFGDFGGGV